MNTTQRLVLRVLENVLLHTAHCASLQAYRRLAFSTKTSADTQTTQPSYLSYCLLCRFSVAGSFMVPHKQEVR